MSAAARRPVGGVLAGGEGRRFGGGKPGARLGGVPLAERAARTLDRLAEPVLLLTDDAGLAERLGRPRRGDRRSGAGPLAGLESVLTEARERGRDGALLLACDMPLVTPAVLEALLDRRGGRGARPEVVLPESSGPLGVEPLCGFYAASVLERVGAALEEGERSMAAFLERVRLRRVPARRFAGPEPPDVLFLNVNTRADLGRAEELLARRERENEAAPPTPGPDRSGAPS